MTKQLKALSVLVVAALSLHASNVKHDMLISADEAVKLIGKEGVVFVTGDSGDTYELGHIKGSVEMYAHHLHHSDKMGNMECAPLFMCKEDAEKYIGSKGITNDTMIIAYDDFKGPNATGVYAFFKSFGHEKLKVLDGGRAAVMKADPEQAVYDALKKEGKKFKKERKKLVKAKAPEAEIAAIKAKEADIKKKMKAQEKNLLVVKGLEKKHAHKEYHIDLSKIDYDWIAGKSELAKASEDIVKNGDKSQYAIIDTRGMIEIIGQRKMDNVARGGHVPGAKFIEWKNFTDFDNKLSFSKLEDMQKVFDKYGVRKDQTVYAYCQVGAGRSTEIISALKMLGYKNAKVYTGSWDEWGNDMNLPIRR